MFELSVSFLVKSILSSPPLTMVPPILENSFRRGETSSLPYGSPLKNVLSRSLRCETPRRGVRGSRNARKMAFSELQRRGLAFAVETRRSIPGPVAAIRRAINLKRNYRKISLTSSEVLRGRVSAIGKKGGPLHAGAREQTELRSTSRGTIIRGQASRQIYYRTRARGRFLTRCVLGVRGVSGVAWRIEGTRYTKHVDPREIVYGAHVAGPTGV